MPPVKPNADKPRSPRKTFFRLLRYLSGEYRLLAIIFVLIVIHVVSSLLSSYLLRPIINDYILPGDVDGLLQMLILLGGIYLAGVVATFTYYRLLNRVGQRTVARMRAELFHKMEQLPLKYFDTHAHGDLMSRYTNDVDKVSEVLSDNLAELFSSSFLLIGIVCIMLFISPILTMVTLVVVPVMFLSVGTIVTRSRRYFSEQQKAMGQVNGYIEEMISGQKVVKGFGYEKQVIKEFEALNQVLNEKAEKAQYYSGMMMPIVMNMSTLNYVFVTIVGAFLSIYRGFDVGGLAAFLQYSRQFGGPINSLAILYNNLQAALAGSERIFEMMDEPVEPVDKPDALEPEEVKGAVEMKEVFFEYDPGKPILKGISFRVDPGKKLALVGTTGAGKTTIMSLLPRFFEIMSGSITLDGYPITDWAKAHLRSKLAVVFQDTHLFTGSVRENIRYGRLEATDEEVEAAAKLASAHSFISSLPHGYDTILENDGANLSQGQRQLLNIARAAVSEPSILLLDEATSNIDTRSELKIQEGLDQLLKGRTSIIIAHRLSTIRNADQILVLEHGRIIERGSHDELLKLGGKYHSMFTEQSR